MLSRGLTTTTVASVPRSDGAEKPRDCGHLLLTFSLTRTVRAVRCGPKKIDFGKRTGRCLLLSVSQVPCVRESLLCNGCVWEREREGGRAKKTKNGTCSITFTRSLGTVGWGEDKLVPVARYLNISSTYS